jgi:COP9 signalosome complex subunit 2
MTNLVAAYQDRNVQEAEKILRGELTQIDGRSSWSVANKATITDDPFIAYFINDLLRSLRTQYIIDLIKPYTRLELQFLAKVSFVWLSNVRSWYQSLNVTRAEAEGLVVSLILDEKIKGKIDQVNGLLILERL